ncbi:MAG: hypothetical protein OEZ48_01625 [Candidatus Bathyarchaeota archaeon]|nr:hypothetical protein [Candidatus Bathyarchaeota archaeon]
MGLSYGVLRAFQLKGMRNGNWRLLDGFQRGLYRACMVYARLRRSVISSKLVGLLTELMGKLGSTMRVKALKAAREEVERAVPIYVRAGIFSWAPRLHSWLRDKAYLLWLGFMKLNAPYG